jgi:hypothetical protein
MSTPSIAWSDFARERYRPGMGHSYFEGDETALVELIAEHWGERRPGHGREDLSRVVIVPLPPTGFVCGTVKVEENTELRAAFTRRQADEDGYIEISAAGPREPARHAAAVLYSAATLLENGGSRSSEADWEIVSVQASPLADEPMRPLTMARNLLSKAGGTPCEYSVREFAEAIWYWSGRCSVHEDGNREARIEFKPASPPSEE